MLEIFIGFNEKFGHIFSKEDEKKLLGKWKDILYLSVHSKRIKAFNIP